METSSKPVPQDQVHPGRIDASAINAILELIKHVEDGELSRDAALAILRGSLPEVDEDHLSAMLPNEPGE